MLSKTDGSSYNKHDHFVQQDVVYEMLFQYTMKISLFGEYNTDALKADSLIAGKIGSSMCRRRVVSPMYWNTRWSALSLVQPKKYFSGWFLALMNNLFYATDFFVAHL